MALVLKDRVRETSISTGTGTINVLGAVTGYQTFGSAIGSGNTCYYTIYNQGTNEWEVGLGTVGSGTLARNTVLSSSNAGSLVNFSAGTKDVFVTYPAEKAVYEDAAGNITPSALVVTSLTDSGLTSGRVTYASTGGLLVDSANLTFNGTTLTSTGFSGALNGTVGASTPAAGTFTSLSDSGNLTFTGTGNRITGDFSSATLANRVAFQTSTTNGSTTIMALPNGTGPNAQLLLRGSSVPQDDSFGQVVLAGGSDFRIGSGASGTGSYLPMTFYTGGSERMRIDTSGNVGIGTASPSTRLDVRGAIVASDGGTQEVRLNTDGNIEISRSDGVPFIDFKSSTAEDYDCRIQQVSNGLTFQTGGNGSASERMHINADGSIRMNCNGSVISHAFNYNENGGEIDLYDETGVGATLIDQANNNTRVLELINGSNLQLGLGPSNTTGSIMFMGAGYAERMRIDSSGRVTTPNQPAFSAYSDANNNVVYNANSTIVFNQTRFNTGNHYNTSTGRFTAPVAGAYMFCLNLYSNDGGYSRYRLLRNGSDVFCGQGGIAGNGVQATLAGVIYLNANDFVVVNPAYNNATVFQEINHTTFSGFLIG